MPQLKVWLPNPTLVPVCNFFGEPVHLEVKHELYLNRVGKRGKALIGSYVEECKNNAVLPEIARQYSFYIDPHAEIIHLREPRNLIHINDQRDNGVGKRKYD